MVTVDSASQGLAAMEQKAEQKTEQKIEQEIAEKIEKCCNRDRFRLRRRLQKLSRQTPGKQNLDKQNPDKRDNELSALIAAIETSVAIAASRRAHCPNITYPENLPISERRAEIAEAISGHQVVIVAGETGSGKTTQLPKICLELGRGATGLIGHTQPRRIAARTVASRIAEELDCELGEEVGYQVRFSDHSGDKTLVKLMTDGILLAEIQNDRFLSRYDTLIIDEAHERSLNIDFLLGYLKQILPKRPDLKLIITSATIDVERFSKHFDGAPVVQVSGRSFPVEIRYQAPVDKDEDLIGATIDAIEDVLSLPKRGDILVFFSSEREIREASLRLRKRDLRDLEILPLYGRLGLADQNRVFQQHRGVRVVLATNVAETSLTVPGIVYVVDTGYARISRYSYRTKVQRLPIEPISQASANQRAGRCGRVADGVCIRLYTEQDFNNRPEYTDPEIVRTNLAAVILKMLHFRIGEVRSFPFIDPPDHRLINDGFQLLTELGAVDQHDKLNPVGQTLSRLPIDPRLGRTLIAAQHENCLQEVLVIVSALSIQDPRERPADKRQAADEKHRQWQDPASDFIALVNLWKHLEVQRGELNRSQFDKYCRRQFLSPLRVREWRELHHQLHHSCRELKLADNAKPADISSIHRALLTGLLSRIGFRHEKHEYLGVRNSKFSIFPGSGVFKSGPKWLMAAELIETTRLYAHCCGVIDPESLSELAAHLVKKSYSEPHYHAANGQVMAWEKQSLYGLVIQERKRVSYGKIDPPVARQVFIQAALVEGAYAKSRHPQAKKTPAIAIQGKQAQQNKAQQGKSQQGRSQQSKLEPAEFFQYNQNVLTELHELEDKLRRRDIAADEREWFQFYDERLPADIISLASFERWRKVVEKDQPRLLFIDRERLLSYAPADSEVAQFPTSIEWEGHSYPLSYRFEPAHADDGVSVDIPVAILHQVPAHLFDWLVPGLLRDKCIELLKSLPRPVRKQLVPVPNTVDKLLPGLLASNTSLMNVALTQALSKQIQKSSGIKIDPKHWQEDKLDSFYRVNFRLLDETGALLEQSRALAELRHNYRGVVRDTLDESLQDALREGLPNALETRGLTSWNFEALPELSVISRGKLEVRAYPALIDQGGSVALQLLDTPALAEQTTRLGLLRLATLELAQTVKYLKKQLFRTADLTLVAAGLSDKAHLSEDVIAAAVYRAVFTGKPIPRTQAEYQALLQGGKGDIAIRTQQLESMVLGLCDDLKNLRGLLVQRTKTHARAAADGKAQLDYLLRPGFMRDAAVGDASVDWLVQYPRYMKAAVARFDKLPALEARDQDAMDIIGAALDWWRQQVAGNSDSVEVSASLENFRFMLEEYRVSLYAQQLKTLKPVSAKRLAALQQQIEADN